MTEMLPSAFDATGMFEEVTDGQAARTYAARRNLFAQGGPADAIFYLQRGRVKLSLVSPRGKEAVIAILESGEFFGEGCLAGQSVRMVTATSVTPCSVVRIDKAVMTRLLHERAAVAEKFMAHLLARNIRIEEDLADQLFNSSEKRLARVLLQMAHLGKEAPTQPTVAKLSQQTLADMVGTTRSRVNFFMNKFRRLGLIDYGAGMSSDLQVNGSLLNVILRD
ncbi:MAG TPA: Crp/Fnr family transcriptional regulator [Candidatus Elarobacter sp.]|nr:Crp/Fnr family transcriptional regulator [Candidatus Elarobacter sp.]